MRATSRWQGHEARVGVGCKIHLDRGSFQSRLLLAASTPIDKDPRLLATLMLLLCSLSGAVNASILSKLY